MTQDVTITSSNILISGAGSGSTKLYVPATYVSSDPKYAGLLMVGANSARKWSSGAVITTATADLAAGDFVVHVNDPTVLQKGQEIVIRQCFWESFVEEFSNNFWNVNCANDRNHAFMTLNKVRRACRSEQVESSLLANPYFSPHSARLFQASQLCIGFIRGIPPRSINWVDVTPPAPPPLAVSTGSK